MHPQKMHFTSLQHHSPLPMAVLIQSSPQPGSVGRTECETIAKNQTQTAHYALQDVQAERLKMHMQSWLGACSRLLHRWLAMPLC